MSHRASTRSVELSLVPIYLANLPGTRSTPVGFRNRQQTCGTHPYTNQWDVTVGAVCRALSDPHDGVTLDETLNIARLESNQSSYPDEGDSSFG